MRVILFTGGEGTARIATITAEAAVRQGNRTVLLGVDGVSQPGLQVRPPRPLAWLEAGWPPIVESVVRASEIPALPGVTELQLWSQLHECLADPSPDAVIVDCGSPGQAAAFFGVAETLPWLLDRIVPATDRVAAAVRGWVEPLRAAAAVQPSVRLVLTAAPDLVGIAREAAGRIAFHGYPLEGIVVERILPASSDPRLERLSAAHRTAVGALASEFAKIPVHQLFWDQDPAELYGSADPVAPGPTPDRPVVTREQTGYEWVLPLPYTTRDRLDLARSGDELILTRDQDRRILPLPSGLRRCTVAGATMRSGELRIRFVPDPALWPEGAATGRPAPQASWPATGRPAPQASWPATGRPAPQASWPA